VLTNPLLDLMGCEVFIGSFGSLDEERKNFLIPLSVFPESCRRGNGSGWTTALLIFWAFSRR